MEIRNDIDIDAPVETVWALTLDIEGWPAITPTMRSVERLDQGPLRPGSTVRVEQPGQRPTVWTVTEVVPNQRFAWRAKVWGIPTVASHDLTPITAGCRNSLTVTMSGRGAALAGWLIGRQVRKAVATENLGFKRRAERDEP